MKYENIDLLDALQKIMDIHTEHYKEDFELDQKLIRSLAATQSSEDKHLLWMSRPHGTHVMREREVYIEDTYENKAWEFYHDQTSDDILAYSIEITGTENGSVVGNLIELDYDAHVERMKQLTVTIDKVAVTFEDQNTYYLPFQSYRREMTAMQEEHGKVRSVAYLPESERELQMILRRERLKTSFHAQPGNIEEHIHRLEEQHSTLPVYDRETEILYDVLSQLKMKDVELDFDADGLVASDEHNTWHGAEFYKFLIDEAAVFFNADTAHELEDALSSDFRQLAEHNGVPFPDKKVETLEAMPLEAQTVYNEIKEAHPDAIVGFAQNGYFEIYGEDAKAAAAILGTKLLQKELEGGGHVLVTGFREDEWAASTSKLWSKGNDVFLSHTGEDGTQETVKDLRGEDYFPVGLEWCVNDQVYKITDVNYAADTVTLVNLSKPDQPPIIQNNICEFKEVSEMYGMPFSHEESAEMKKAFLAEKKSQTAERQPKKSVLAKLKESSKEAKAREAQKPLPEKKPKTNEREM